MTEPGHNSKNDAGAKLLSYIERVENLAAERQTFTDDIKDVYAEAKGNGYDVKVIRKIVALRKRDKEDVQEENALLETYLHSIGQEYLV